MRLPTPDQPVRFIPVERSLASPGQFSGNHELICALELQPITAVSV
jgi:hypothetical protein